MTYRFPSFLDAHSHLSGVAVASLQPDLSELTDPTELISKLKESSAVGSGLLTVTVGELLPKLDLSELDSLTDRPLVLRHTSGHYGYFNHAVASIVGVESGMRYEKNFIPYLSRLPLPSTDALLDALDSAQHLYASRGYTTAQDGAIDLRLAKLYLRAAETERLFLDVVTYAVLNDADSIYRELAEYTSGYRNHLRLGGVKVFLDGSPQAGTANMSDTDFSAPESMTDAELCNALRYAGERGIQLLAHCNGDLAARQLVRCLRAVDNARPRRTVMIHAQFLPSDLMPAMRAYGVIPSFFVSHVRAYGDLHLKNFGSRAELISPVRSAISAGLRPTLHEDSPVLPPDPLRSLTDAVRRLSASGRLLGESERVSVSDALTCLTANAAYQYFEEDSKGFCTSKDFIELNTSPYSLPLDKLDTLRVVRTVKDDRDIYLESKKIGCRC